MVKRVLLFLGICLLIAGSSVVLAMEPDARSFAMGGAYTAVVDDATAVYWNPARLPNIRFLSIALGVGLASEDPGKTMEAFETLLDKDDFEEIDEIDIDANASGAFLGAIATRWVGVGIYGNVELDADVKSKKDEEALEFDWESGQTASARANGVLAIAKPFKRFNLGLALKVVGDGRYTSGQSASAKVGEGGGEGEESSFTTQTYGTGYSADLALSTSLTRMIQLGFVAQDVFSSIEYERTIDGDIPLEPGKYKDKLDPTYRAGIAVCPGFGLTLAGDITSNGDIHLGFEKNTLFNGLSLRGGMVSQDGVTEYRAGFGLNLAWFHAGIGIGFSDDDTPKALMLDASLTF